MINEKAWEILKNPEGKKSSEIGEAIDVSLPQYRPKNRAKGGYEELSKEIGKKKLKVSEHGSFRLSQIHRIYRLLPQGIRWKIDQREISIAQGLQIARLESEEDQWVLALAVAYAVKKSKGKRSAQLSEEDCKNIVKRVLENGDSIRDSVGKSGVLFKKLDPSVAVSKFSSPEEWIAVSKEAWNRHMNRPAFYSHLIAQKYSVLSDIEKVADQIEEMNQKLQSQFLAKIADELRQLSELRHPAAEEVVQKPEAEEKEKPTGSGENPSGSSEKVDVEKAINVPSSGDESKSPKPSEDGEQFLFSGGDDKPKGKGKRKKKSAKKSGNMKRR